MFDKELERMFEELEAGKGKGPHPWSKESKITDKYFVRQLPIMKRVKRGWRLFSDKWKERCFEWKMRKFSEEFENFGYLSGIEKTEVHKNYDSYGGLKKEMKQVVYLEDWKKGMGKFRGWWSMKGWSCKRGKIDG